MRNVVSRDIRVSQIWINMIVTLENVLQISIHGGSIPLDEFQMRAGYEQSLSGAPLSLICASRNVGDAKMDAHLER